MVAGDGSPARVFSAYEWPSVGPPSATRPPIDVQVGSLAQIRVPRRRRPWDQLTPAQTVELANDALACTVLNDLAADVWHIAPLDPLPCPITVAWSEKDTLLPMAEYASALPQRMPQCDI